MPPLTRVNNDAASVAHLTAVQTVIREEIANLHAFRSGCACDSNGPCAHHAHINNQLGEAVDDIQNAIDGILKTA